MTGEEYCLCSGFLLPGVSLLPGFFVSGKRGGFSGAGDGFSGAGEGFCGAVTGGFTRGFTGTFFLL